jgi:general secretion pathway protein F
MDATFDLVVRSGGGGVRSVAVNASDETAARSRAMQDGFQVLSCVPRGNPGRQRARASLGRRHALDVAAFAHQLASLLSAGLSIAEALRTLAAHETAGPRRSLLLDIVRKVSEGLPLSKALEQQSRGFPPLLVATVRASEQTGDLPTALLRYAAHLQTIKGLREKVVGAAIYPLLLLVVGALVVLFLLGVVVPKFAILIESTRRELPWSSQLLLTFGRLVATHASAVGVGAVIGLATFLLAARHVVRDGGRARWIESVPLVGSSIRQFRHAQLYRTTGMLVKGGITAPRALQLGANLLGVDDHARLTQAVTRLHEGRSISSALQEVGLADPVAASMLAVAERTGALADILERIAAFHEARLQRSVEMASRLFEPLLMIVIGLVIGAIVVLMYLPIFDLASSLQ